MKRNSSLLALLIAVLMMFSIAGCSKQAAEPAPAPAEPAASAPAEPAATPAEPAAPADPAATPADPAASAPAAGETTASTPADPAKPAASTPAAPAKPAATTPAAPAKPAPTKPAVTTPAAPAAPAVPASLTGDKAKAYTLLAACKYDGNATGDLNATIYKVPIMGDTDISVKTTSSGSSSKMTTKGVPGLVGGDVTDASFAAVPFSEIVSGNAANIEAFLKGASSVTVAGNTITVSSTATASFTTLLNKVSAKVTWSKANVKLSYTINVGSGKVSSIKISSTSAKCTANGNPYDAKVGGTVTY